MEIGYMNSNPDRLLAYLDNGLNASIELTLFGRAALALGFPGHANYARTVDVDVILATGQAETLLQSTNFWEIVEKLNEHYAAEGLYMTHFFEESQVVLRTEWLTGRMVLPRTFHNIKLFRPANEDLFLTKCMRYDPIDLDDAFFICRESGWTSADIRKLLDQATIPALPELREQVDLCIQEVIRRLVGQEI